MALGPFVLTADVTVTAGATAGKQYSEARSGAAWSGSGSSTFKRGQVVHVDSAAGTDTAAKLLYQAIGSGNLRPYAAGDYRIGASN